MGYLSILILLPGTLPIFIYDRRAEAADQIRKRSAY